MKPRPKDESAGRAQAWAALVAADRHAAFGPLFFMQHLRGLVRDHCPDPGEGMPTVHLHLADGDLLDVCHIIGIAPHWIALAVRESEHEEGTMVMRTEFVPYPMVTRVAIRTVRRGTSHHVGFDVGREPVVFERAPEAAGMTPEEALRAVAGEGGPVSMRDAHTAEHREGAQSPSGSAGASGRTRG